MSNELNGIVYVNGEYCEAKNAKISMFDRGFIFGDGIYEVIPVVNSKLVDKEDFWKRFERSLGEIDIKIPFSHSEYEKIFYEIIKRNEIIEGGIYTQLTRGVAPRSFEFIQELTPTCVVFGYKTNIIDNEYAKSGIKVISVPDIRWKRRDIKSISLLAQCVAKTQAFKAGVYEGLMVEDGYVTEGSSSSAFIVKNGVLITKPLSNEILPGIRRKVILEFAHEIGLKVKERAFSMEEVYEADEAFISAATIIILPIITADGRMINNGKIGQYATLLRNLYCKRLIEESHN